jgi:hypothetical protein
MAVPFDLIVPDSFFFELGLVLQQFPDKQEYLDAKLGDALEFLEKNGPSVASPHGSGGEKFAVPLDGEFVLVFLWKTDRDGDGHPLADHLQLLTVEQKKR